MGLSLALAIVGCGEKAEPTAPLSVIMETDIGNDIDDALAMDMLYKYIDAGKINLLAVNINKEGIYPPEYVDILNTWYGYPDIPIGVVHDGAKCDNPNNYTEAVDTMTSDGKPAFARSLTGKYESLPDAVQLYRKILSRQPDASVTIVSVGFSTNLVRLMDSQPDSLSPLSGMELISKKVRLLVTMAGDFTRPDAKANAAGDVPFRCRISNPVSCDEHRERFRLDDLASSGRSVQGLLEDALRSPDMGSDCSPLCRGGSILVHCLSCREDRGDR